MTETSSRPQYARIEQPFGVAPPVFHCPICGQATIDAEDGEAIPCPHLAFIYSADDCEFVYTSDDFEQKTRDFDDEYITRNCLLRLLGDAGYGNSLLAVEITYGGMACGPVWYVHVFGFDYGTLADADVS